MLLRVTTAAAALACVTTMGCSTMKFSTNNLTTQVSTNPQIYIPLCGYLVAGLTRVEVEERRGHAHVRGVPEALAGAPTLPLCEGDVTFEHEHFELGTGRGVEAKNLAYDIEVARRGIEPGPGIPAAQRAPGLRWRGGPIPVALGQPVSGVLREGHSALRGGQLVNEYAIELPNGAPVVFEVGWEAQHFAYGALALDATLTKDGRDVAGPLKKSATGAFEWDLLVPEAGVYVLTVAGKPGQKGELSFRARRATAFDIERFPPRDWSHPARTTLGATEAAILRPDASRRVDGKLADDYLIDLPKDEAITIRLHASGSNVPWGRRALKLIVLLDGAVVAESPADPKETVFDVRLRAPSAGTYTLRVTTQSDPEQKGPYELQTSRDQNAGMSR